MEDFDIFVDGNATSDEVGLTLIDVGLILICVRGSRCVEDIGLIGIVHDNGDAGGQSTLLVTCKCTASGDTLSFFSMSHVLHHRCVLRGESTLHWSPFGVGAVCGLELGASSVQ